MKKIRNRYSILRKKRIERIIKKRERFKKGKNIYLSLNGMRQIKMKSSWEVKFGHFLDTLSLTWWYEPFGIKVGIGYYYPDFYVTEEKTFYEIKGRLFPKAKRKIEQFRLLYPDIKLVVLFQEDLKRMGVL